MENAKRKMTLDDAFRLYEAKKINAGELAILICDIKDASQAENVETLARDIEEPSQSENLTNYKDSEKKQPVRTLK